MKVQCQSSDRISTLPEDTIGKILSHMRIRDALRTSILSKKWRFCWTTMPKLVFDDNMVKASPDSDESSSDSDEASSDSDYVVINKEENNKDKLVIAIFHVLLLHRGPIYELCICLSADAVIVNQIDQIIRHLSWSKNIKELIFDNFEINEYYKLPCSFFSLQKLEHISLKRCKFELPLTFNGFSMLRSLAFTDVVITATMLQQLLTSCPLLEEFTLIGLYQKEFKGGNTCTFVELFKFLPSIQVLNISRNYIKLFAAGCMSQKLPTSLVHLRILVLEVCFQKQDELSSTLCVINSSPNLEKIKLKMVRQVGQTCTALLDPRDYLDLNLDHLKELEITIFHNYAPEMELVKLIMAKSPVLKKARIELSPSVSIEKEVKMLRDLLHLQFPRASPAAKFVIERP